MYKIRIGIWLLLLVSISCDRFSNQEKQTDGGKRIVCISKQYNELIWALGASQQIVAVDISSNYPEAVKKLPTVGYHRALSVEAMLAAKPDLILHDNNIGPEHVIRQLENLKIPMKSFVHDAKTFDDLKELILEMGTFFGKDTIASHLVVQMENDLLKLKAEMPLVKDSLRVLVIHFGRANNSYLVMTKKNTASLLVEMAGGIMAVQDEKAMRQISPEIVANADPDVILMTDYGYDRLGDIEKIKALPGVGATSAAREGRIYRIEEHDLVYLSPRSPGIVRQLYNLLYNAKTGNGE